MKRCLALHRRHTLNATFIPYCFTSISLKHFLAHYVIKGDAAGFERPGPACFTQLTFSLNFVFRTRVKPSPT
jgi:hypothetical protein